MTARRARVLTLCAGPPVKNKGRLRYPCFGAANAGKPPKPSMVVFAGPPAKNNQCSRRGGRRCLVSCFCLVLVGGVSCVGRSCFLFPLRGRASARSLCLFVSFGCGAVVVASSGCSSLVVVFASSWVAGFCRAAAGVLAFLVRCPLLGSRRSGRRRFGVVFFFRVVFAGPALPSGSSPWLVPWRLRAFSAGGLAPPGRFR